MITKTDNYFKKHPFMRRTLEALMVLFMALYPLRHIHIGLDLWDTGYNYANFEYMGLGSMDSMWFFSTYLSNALGHLLTLLPFGKTLLGMNFYTALVVSLCSITAYMFLTRSVKLPKFLVFAGEFIAISLCWCPTALLYNYLTYYFLMTTVICLYYGLLKKRNYCLFIGGIILGLNIFVRFSNLPEAVLIFAVWVYGILETEAKIKGEEKNIKSRERKLGFRRYMQKTLLCMSGYLASVGGMLLFFGIKYGFNAYFDAIKRLFAMTDEASDYTATSMLVGLIKWYKEAGYWTSRLCVFAVAGILLCALAKYLDIQFELKENAGIKLFGRGFNFLGVAYIISAVFAVLSVFWLLFKKKFSYGYYGEYGSILMPCAVLILISVCVCLVQIFKPGNTLEMRLVSGLVLIVILITPIGSNTGIFPVISNMFLIAPFLLNSCGELFEVHDGEGISRYNYTNPLIDRETNRRKKVYEVVWSYVSLFPVKAVMTAFGLLCLFQIVTFGKEFVFTEGHNAWDTYYSVGADKVMNGIRMNYDKASNYGELYLFINEAGLQDNELITYGYIPSLSFYLQMTPAFNPWIDLDSYNKSVLVQDLENTAAEAEEKIAKSKAEAEASLNNVIKDNIAKEGSEEAVAAEAMIISRREAYPVVIVDAKYINYIDVDKAPELGEAKWALLAEYMDKAGYKIVYSNKKYVVLTAAEEE